MSMLGKSEEQITQEMSRSALTNGIQAIGIIVLVLAVLAKAWTLHIESKLETAVTTATVSERLLQSCLKQAPEANAQGCGEREQAVATAQAEVAGITNSFPNHYLLPLFGTVKRDTQDRP